MLLKKRKQIIAAWQGLSGNARGSAWLLAAGLFATVMVTGIKFVGQRLPVLEILFFRQLMVFGLLSVVLFRNFPATFRTRRLKLHMSRCVVSIFAMTTGFTAIVHLPLAEATAISFSRALFATLLAILFLKEVVGVRRWSATFIGFAGVLVVVRPSPDAIDPYAMLALVSAALVAGNMIMTKSLAATEHPVCIMGYHAGVLAIAYSIPAWWFWVEPTLAELFLIAGIAILMSAVQYCVINGYREAEASAAQPLEYVRLLYAAGIGFLVFGEIPTIWTWIGAGLIIGSSLYTLHRNRLQSGGD